ncbi:zinc-binding metallopeptidase family protein [Flavihumibacter profundi]|uniref:zinc-binding metallopeptidase family protein n=1 Tax=Flavihumibacter profundi TaxID=2716883 RepID=UPI001CC74A24|nr:putative zinc-binding peptidase [Flavihumibacter profundi]MBZ5857533.1 putative zinc-binding peptidase [Flavihumibacter profundi]
MKLFNCTNCGHPVYFENVFCLNCNASLGFDVQSLQQISLVAGNNWQYCFNHQFNVCNWLVPVGSASVFCTACQLNRTIPDLTRPEYLEKWNAIEIAKHRLIYQLLHLQLPLVSKEQNEAEGLAFDFIADDKTAKEKKVFTGHDNGVITINIAEADDIEREMARKQMDEVYRTLLGHFRHEVGHYYWDRLIASKSHIYEFRNLFGDESLDYAEALKKYYAEGAPAGWNNHYISAYATMHPWEDWAETWAHYLHIIDTLETAYYFGLSVHPINEATQKLQTGTITDPYYIRDFESIIQLWLPLTFAMNSLNRSMGLKDSYPFMINNAVVDKMKFIHKVVREAASVQPLHIN